MCQKLERNFPWHLIYLQYRVNEQGQHQFYNQHQSHNQQQGHNQHQHHNQQQGHIQHQGHNQHQYRNQQQGHDQQHYQHCRPKLKELCHYSDTISSCWKDLALELNLPQETVNTIDNDHSRIKDKCYHMFSKWLQRTPNSCWSHIVQAMKNVDLLQAAKEVEDAYLCKCRYVYNMNASITMLTSIMYLLKLIFDIL